MQASIYRLRQRDILFFCVLALLCLGMIMVQSAAMHVTGRTAWQWNQLGMKQLGFCFVGVAVFFFVGRRDYRWIAGRKLPIADCLLPIESGSSTGNGKWAMGNAIRSIGNVLAHPVTWLLVTTVILNTLVLFPGIGIEKNGA